MKNILVILMFCFSITCTEESNTKNQFKESNLDWIIGNWERTNDQKDMQTFEHWIKKSNSEYVGFGFTLHNQDTVFKENLKIVQNNGYWYLEVTGVNENPTLFSFSNYYDSSFVCENKENEFPKKIEYSYNQKILTAIISDSSKTISFKFQSK